LNKIAFRLENRTGDEHTTELLLCFPSGSSYSVLQDGKAIQLNRTGDWDYPVRGALKVTTRASKIEIVGASR
jgi:hypothetical protein